MTPPPPGEQRPDGRSWGRGRSEAYGRPWFRRYVLPSSRLPSPHQAADHSGDTMFTFNFDPPSEPDVGGDAEPAAAAATATVASPSRAVDAGAGSADMRSPPGAPIDGGELDVAPLLLEPKDIDVAVVPLATSDAEADAGSGVGSEGDADAEMPAALAVRLAQLSRRLRRVPLVKRTYADTSFELAARDPMAAETDAAPAPAPAPAPAHAAADTETTRRVIDAVHARTDLIPRVYEGGLKTWECAYDVAAYLAHHAATFLAPAAPRSRVRVLELGCGSGVPGLVALRSGVADVDFQDYNRMVLELVTLPNVLANLVVDADDGDADDDAQAVPRLPRQAFPQGGMRVHLGPPDADDSDAEAHDDPPVTPAMVPSRFFYGPWERLAAVILEAGPTAAAASASAAPRYDLIVTSETIYDRATYAALVGLWERVLRVGGRVLLGAKAHYFGCSGSLAEFRAYVDERPAWATDVLWQSERGVARAILCITRLSG
ncbi:hypothetical protein CXG81DRAFT_19545 [Caulochytrium protostelioides]|uniref:protein-histidine N-methyltransferase n=1 Tax=Caulochytrium protostelioides TaxID=1555241 RepID=A0A4P9X5U6_9FUNG|nr:hypothetical protein CAUPRSCDRAFT_11060 [Caulochytrium protostelioides]RKP00508.1 hypothetical protein CXG81DRAFT_19545 [Caulochytrium protostelioides]|eukprot:RKP00508.1 hypothetical protein CXG81DRAFT_19545 [Caulochytrium protostelioides]